MGQCVPVEDTKEQTMLTHIHVDEKSNIQSHRGFPIPGPQHPHSDSVMDELFFINPTELHNILSDKTKNEFDFIVIGSGFCSLAFIERITKTKNKKYNILVLEKGSFFLPEHFQNLPYPFKSTLGLQGGTETYPFKLTEKTAQKQVNDNNGYLTFCHGIIPYFGGRSTLWSAWCPEPNNDELSDWPKDTINILQNKYFQTAKQLLNVVNSDQLETKDNHIYGTLNKVILKKLQTDLIQNMPIFTRVIPAPIAVKSDISGSEYEKFSVCGPILELIKNENGHTVSIVPNCCALKINEDKHCINTSLGDIEYNKTTKIILAMGTLPATTFVVNSFAELEDKAGQRFTGHNISGITCRVHRSNISELSGVELNDTELGAIYIGGLHNKTGLRFHFQFSMVMDINPNKNKKTLLRYSPDVVNSFTEKQLEENDKDYIIFSCGCIGEMDCKNKNIWFKKDNESNDLETNSICNIEESKQDLFLWDTMEESAFDLLENIISNCGGKGIEYWFNDKWNKNGQRPNKLQMRHNGIFHESSTLHLGDDNDNQALCDLNYKLKTSQNVYVTGGALWPRGASWNPTMTMCALAQHLADNLSN
eukprot:548923_1